MIGSIVLHKKEIPFKRGETNIWHTKKCTPRPSWPWLTYRHFRKQSMTGYVILRYTESKEAPPNVNNHFAYRSPRCWFLLCNETGPCHLARTHVNMCKPRLTISQPSWAIWWWQSPCSRFSALSSSTVAAYCLDLSGLAQSCLFLYKIAAHNKTNICLHFCKEMPCHRWLCATCMFYHN